MEYFTAFLWYRYPLLVHTPKENYLIWFTQQSPSFRMSKNDPRNVKIYKHISTAQGCPNKFRNRNQKGLVSQIKQPCSIFPIIDHKEQTTANLFLQTMRLTIVLSQEKQNHTWSHQCKHHLSSPNNFVPQRENQIATNFSREEETQMVGWPQPLHTW